jgi:hypothetical protein
MLRGDVLKLLVAVAIAFLAIVAGPFARQFIYSPFLPKGLQGVKQAFAVPVRIERDAYEYVHVAHVYIDGELVRGVYARIPRSMNMSQYMSEVVVCLAMLKDSRVKKLELRFVPPEPSRFVELRWMQKPDPNVPVELYVEKNVTVFRYPKLDPPYGYGTICLEFTPTKPGFNFESYTISLDAVIEYKGLDYALSYSFTIE